MPDPPLPNRGLRRAALSMGFIWTGLILVANLAHLPPLQDPTGRPLPTGYHLQYPWMYLLFAPVFSTWDALSMLSMSRLRWVGVWALVAVLCAVAALLISRRRGGARGWPIALGLGVPIFLVVGALWRARPIARLTGGPVDEVLVDFHSHTNASHDVRGWPVSGFDVAANRRWHARAGFGAAFITDHNISTSLPADDGRADLPILCPGREASIEGLHVILLGEADWVGAVARADSLVSLMRSLRPDSILAIASLPEYSLHAWDRLGWLMASGVTGFEVVNASPKANEFPRVRRDSVLALTRRTRGFVVGVSDMHGWGATSMVWNAVTVPQIGRTRLCRDIIGVLARGAPSTSRIVERARLRSDDWWPEWLAPIGAVWMTWRTASIPLVVSWIGWTWLLVSLRAHRR